MKNDGRFKKGRVVTSEVKAKQIEGIKRSWKLRSGYHGMKGSKFHNSWRSIKTRCHGTAGFDSIKKYKDKGITYCEKWKTFQGFYEDMFSSYIEGLTIDRLDNSKGYFKENCRWATAKMQANNKTNNVRLEYDGQIKTLAEWAIYLNVTFNSIKMRYYNRYLKGKITLKELIEFKRVKTPAKCI